jgi:hypothetical protein
MMLSKKRKAMGTGQYANPDMFSGSQRPGQWNEKSTAQAARIHRRKSDTVPAKISRSWILTQSMLQVLAKHEHTNYHLLFTDDESWMFYAHDHRTKWIASWDDADEIERPSYFHQKIMFMIFFNGTGEYKTAVLSGGQKVNCVYFIEFELRHLTEICYP